MMKYFDLTEETVNVGDSVYGVVVGSCCKGLFLLLDQGEEAFACFGTLDIGTKVLCSIIKKGVDSEKTFVEVDAVLSDSMVA